jgi:hypothetical protein
VIYDILRTPFYMLEQRQLLVEINATSTATSTVSGTAWFCWPGILRLLTRSTTRPYLATFEVTKAEIAAYEDSGLAGRSGWSGTRPGRAAGGRADRAGRPLAGGRVLAVGLWLLFPAQVLLLTNPLPWQRYYIGCTPRPRFWPGWVWPRCWPMPDGRAAARLDDLSIQHGFDGWARFAGTGAVFILSSVLN